MLWDGPVDTFSMLRPRDQPLEIRRDLTLCRAVSPTIFSGLGDMPNGVKTLLVSSGPPDTGAQR